MIRARYSLTVAMYPDRPDCLMNGSRAEDWLVQWLVQMEQGCSFESNEQARVPCRLFRVFPCVPLEFLRWWCYFVLNLPLGSPERPIHLTKDFRCCAAARRPLPVFSVCS